VASVLGCTNPTATNYNPLATCDDGSCTFTCPDPGTCDDGVCSNGVETWNGTTCACQADTAPTPCVSDGNCTNGVETWDATTCTCTNVASVLGCTNATALNYNPLATCDDGSCMYNCPDPGNCSDNNCTNGLETWDGNNCICVDGLAPIPCADDNDCTNGFEVWNSNTCTCTITPPIFGCMNPDSENYDPNANCGDNSCVSPCPDPGCDDQNCLNGLESWDPLSCVCNVQPILAGCTDSQALNFNPNAMCEDGSCIYPLLYIPSAFSPNGDEINDVFRPVGGPIIEFEMHIYDRWGKHYISSSDPVSGWDGTLSGSNCEIGVYVYWMNVQIQGQQSRIYKGNITLIR